MKISILILFTVLISESFALAESADPDFEVAKVHTEREGYYLAFLPSPFEGTGLVVRTSSAEHVTGIWMHTKGEVVRLDSELQVVLSNLSGPNISYSRSDALNDGVISKIMIIFDWGSEFRLVVPPLVEGMGQLVTEESPQIIFEIDSDLNVTSSVLDQEYFRRLLNGEVVNL